MTRSYQSCQSNKKSMMDHINQWIGLRWFFRGNFARKVPYISAYFMGKAEGFRWRFSRWKATHPEGWGPVALMEGPSLVAAARLEEGIPKLPLDLAEKICFGEWRSMEDTYTYIYIFIYLFIFARFKIGYQAPILNLANIIYIYIYPAW